MHRLMITTVDDGTLQAEVTNSSIRRTPPHPVAELVGRYLAEQQKFLDRNPDMNQLEAGQRVLQDWFNRGGSVGGSNDF